MDKEKIILLRLCFTLSAKGFTCRVVRLQAAQTDNSYIFKATDGRGNSRIKKTHLMQFGVLDSVDDYFIKMYCLEADLHDAVKSVTEYISMYVVRDIQGNKRQIEALENRIPLINSLSISEVGLGD